MRIYIVSCIDENSEIRSVQSFPTPEGAKEKMKEILRDAKEYFKAVHGQEPTYENSDELSGAVGNDDHCYAVQVHETEFKESELSNTIEAVVKFYVEEERRHWEESGEPEDHIYMSLLKLWGYRTLLKP
jgi:hypothetical protein